MVALGQMLGLAFTESAVVNTQAKHSCYGLMAEFSTAEDLIEATERVHAEGYRKLDAYSPFPLEGIAELVHEHRGRLSRLVLIGGIVGAIVGFAMQYYVTVIDYPLNIGGRPLNSWPSYIPITFELTILFAAFSAVLGMLGLNGLPEPYHPVFNVERFAMASRDRFFLVIESKDPRFDQTETRKLLEKLHPSGVFEVER